MIRNIRVNHFCLALLFLGCLLLNNVKAQRLYDEERDKQAQEAVKLAEEVINKSTFENQLKNLDTFSKRDFELHLKGAKRQMEYEINGFRTWGQINGFVNRVEITLNTADFIDNNLANDILADLQANCSQEPRTEFGKAICISKQKLGELETEVSNSETQGKALEEELKTRLEKIGEFETLIEKAKTYFKSDSKKTQTLKDLTDVFINMSKSYVNFTNKIQTIRNQPQNEVRLILNRIAVETLQVEADHWKTVGEIKLRRAEEQKDLFRLVKDYKFRFVQIAKCLKVSPDSLLNEKITVALSKAKTLALSKEGDAPPCKITIFDDPDNEETLRNEEIVSYLLNAFYSASALAARGETPFKLAELRLAQEEHRYSIRQSAVIARGYEIILQNGTKRLERYYAGGIKPEKIAQLIYSAATVAIPAVIAGK